MLRIDINLLFEIINLIILFVAFKLILFKPVQKIIAQRQEEADKEYKEAEASKKEADAKKTEYENSILEIDEERKQVLAEAHKSANEEYVRIVEEANAKAHQINESAKISAEKQKEEILKNIEVDIADMVVNATSKIAAVKTDNKTLYDEFINKAGDSQ